MRFVRAIFAPRFNRADFYGVVAAIVAMGNGVPPLIVLPVLLAWAGFSAFMERRIAP